MTPSPPRLPTVGEIARRLGQPVHRIAYVIRARQISASGRAGNARVFPEDAVEVIARELQRIGSAKSTNSTANTRWLTDALSNERGVMGAGSDGLS